MTALQHWLSPVDPRNVMGAIRDVWRELTSSPAGEGQEPQLMGPGLERC
ncbi:MULTISPECIES: hypothetical protein [Mycolicibacterium]|jgi:hypothetical protein|uniref:Uncharacterized protein n=1 Tax=Mycolicibacterium austroafricanum TaxID=39687 RepID=A0ABT8HHU0_MYCAO|nr:MULTISPECIES: hypothetical protein [Mycolicibacterium]MCV7128180.1 hypothetical protein [Mycolicibacterium vanbaalenii PYR-1]MDN4520311.1 hypothetical protein [Mycolicibacterium austroafricanum]MDW5614278.1 hypothetical protein [Mycolicibacterium sp. D5.8-2]QRZ09245.1 hypothetical protein JN090_12505 [Mycolicibacterium austroafricanum]QZT59422.1 hypothetical protein JN084_13180 [Mycolicibacterium austroafricanum]